VPPAQSVVPSFFVALFDFKFERFVTKRVLGVFYMLCVVSVGIGYLIGIVTAFASGNALAAFMVLIVGAIFGFIIILLSRMMLEVSAALIGTAENTLALVEKMDKTAS
jgi:hypothetical protein